jgi:hypothetical protein
MNYFNNPPRILTRSTGDAIIPSDEIVAFNRTSSTQAVGLYSARGQKKAIVCYNVDSTTITITPDSGTINGAASFALTGNGSQMLLVPDGISNWIALQTIGTDLATALAATTNSNSQQSVGATIATTGNTDVYVTAPYAGSLSAATVTPLVALTADDTNYITWTITNLGQAGAGTAAMLAATNPNTTKATGGTGLAINTPRALTLNGTAANLVVAVNDLLLIRAAATGTLANTVTRPIYKLTFVGA